MQATGSCELIPPFGGRLVDLVCHEEDERRSLLERAERLPRVPLSLRAQYDLEMLAVGAFSPLDRFMGRWDYASVLSDMRLTDGTVFPIPLAVPVRMPALRDWLRDVALTDEAGTVLAVMEVEQIYPFDSLREMRAVLGATDTAHPLVAESADWPVHYLSGHPRVLDLPRHRLHGPLCLTPAETRARLAALGHSQVVAFQTRNPMHRIHEELTKRAAHAVGGALLLHPAVGVTRPQDVNPALRVEAYEVLVRNYYDPATTLLSLMPLAMRFAGPREAVWHSIIRRNYGATHLIIGRDHAGPGKDSQGAPFYGPYEAQALAERYAAEVGVQPIAFEELVYLADEDRYEEAGKVPPGARVFSISGTQVRDDYLAKGKRLPAWFTRPEVAQVLQTGQADGSGAPA
ncbi:MAG: sulfate adenylyltransferase [Thermoleophilia bacterium]